nr:hypothetical protein [Bradyrhizobium elkanii]
MPNDRSWSAGPIPDSIKRRGESIAPAQSSTSLAAPQDAFGEPHADAPSTFDREAQHVRVDQQIDAHVFETSEIRRRRIVASAVLDTELIPADAGRDLPSDIR